jgi:hypothetical protein
VCSSDLQAIVVKAGGVFSVLTNNGNCSSLPSATNTIVVDTLPTTPSITANGATTFCLGDSVTLSSSAANGNVWSNGATTQSVTIKTSDVLSVKVINSNGCSSASSGLISVTAVNPAQAPVISTNGATAFCQGDSLLLTSSATSGNVWTNGQTTQSIWVKTSGQFGVLVSNGTCTSDTAFITINVSPVPSTPTISINGTLRFCQGNSVTLTSSASTGNLWSNGATTQTITVSTAGNYSVVATNGSCSSASSIITSVLVDTLPRTPSITANGPTTFCSGDSVTLTSSVPSGNLWSNGAATQSVVVKASEVLTVKVTNANGCTSPNSSPISVTAVTPTQAPTIAVSGSATFCQGDSVVLTSSASSGNIWSNGATMASATCCNRSRSSPPNAP